MRPKSTFYASDSLRRLYRERVGDSMTQAEFAKQHQIGGQSMLAMILSKAKPLPIETAPKLAKALRCTIYDICPEMAEFIKVELMPSLGKNLRRAALWMLVALPLVAPQQADARIGFNITLTEYTLRGVLELLLRVLARWSVRLRTGVIRLPSACAHVH